MGYIVSFVRARSSMVERLVPIQDSSIPFARSNL
jgi:hypothetical protein